MKGRDLQSLLGQPRSSVSMPNDASFSLEAFLRIGASVVFAKKKRLNIETFFDNQYNIHS